MKCNPAPGDLERKANVQVFEQSFHMRHSYPVYFMRGLFAEACDVLTQVVSGARTKDDPARVLCVIDDGVAAAHPALGGAIESKSADAASWGLSERPLTVPGGEAIKNDRRAVEELYAAFARIGLDRHSYVVAIGGGAVLDAVGFAAATAHRGIRLVRVPTTVLSQNDSGVGVKNGINYLGQKNFLGTFAPPWAVINDFDFLRTLTPRDTISGMAEAVKVALIKDRALFEWLERSAPALRDGAETELEELVQRTAMLHLRHISSSGDPFESGSSRPLDFGHWAAHKLEALTEHRLRHGEAVAVGIALDTLYSARVGLLDVRDAERVFGLLVALGLPTYDAMLAATKEDGSQLYLDGLEEFRQHLGGRLCVTLLNGLGRSTQVDQLDASLLEDCRRELCHRSEAH